MKQLVSFLSACLAIATCAVVAAAATPSLPARHIHRATVGHVQAVYSQSSVVRVKPVFLPLPPGAVRPTGWLRDWAEDAAHGITGHLDERHPTFRDGWKGRPIPLDATLARLAWSSDIMSSQANGTGWPLDAPVKLIAPAARFDWRPTELQPLLESPVASGTPAQISLVPYGCTKVRVSMFPVTSWTWRGALTKESKLKQP
jgi:hypothetical protein